MWQSRHGGALPVTHPVPMTGRRILFQVEDQYFRPENIVVSKSQTQIPPSNQTQTQSDAQLLSAADDALPMMRCTLFRVAGPMLMIKSVMILRLTKAEKMSIRS
jgi:hypothetical protein